MSATENFEHAFLARVEALLDVKRYEQACAEAAKGLGSCPESYYLHYYLAFAWLMLENTTESAKAITQCFHLEPNQPDAYYLCSLIENKRLRFDRELTFAKRAVELYPDDPTYLRRLAEAQQQSGMMKEAKETTAMIVQIEPDSSHAHEQLAVICMALSDWKTAETHFRAALTIDPTQTYLHHSLALVLIEQKRKKEAIDILYNALKSDSTNTQLQQQLYDSVVDYLPFTLFKRAWHKKLSTLAQPVQNFYLDKRDRQNFFTNNSLIINIALWLIAIVGLAALFNLFYGR